MKTNVVLESAFRYRNTLCIIFNRPCHLYRIWVMRHHPGSDIAADKQDGQIDGFLEVVRYIKERMSRFVADEVGQAFQLARVQSASSGNGFEDSNVPRADKDIGLFRVGRDFKSFKA